MSVRKPAVAGQFYPKEKHALEEMINHLLGQDSQKVSKNRVRAMILPHAGYMYSGRVAAQTVNSCALTKTFVILGPNHTGQGEHFSIMTEGIWQMPMGDVAIDQELAETIIRNSQYLKVDSAAHRFEHSIEVIIPFLQNFQKEITMVPIVVMTANKSIYSSIAQDIVRGLKASGRINDVMIIASSDMTHFESQTLAEKKDQYAIGAILNLNTDELIRRVDEWDISMCGVAPVSIMLEVVKDFGAKKATLVKYQTSGDTTGDFSSVVGYAGLRIS